LLRPEVSSLSCKTDDHAISNNRQGQVCASGADFGKLIKGTDEKSGLKLKVYFGRRFLEHMQKEHHFLSQQESNFLNALAFVRRVATFKLRGACSDAAEDIVQKVGLNLWRWSIRRKELMIEESAINVTPTMSELTAEQDAALDEVRRAIKIGGIREHKTPLSAAPEVLSQNEWLRLANTAAHNEISSFFRGKYRREAILTQSSLENAAHKAVTQGQTLTLTSNPEGNSRAEITSLLRQVWKIIQELSPRQKYSFLLQKEELIINLLSHGCCRRQEIAKSLCLDKAEFDILLISLPLTDENIRNLLKKKTGTRLTLRQIWTARAKAKARLAAGLKLLL
jgi:hypothetical protein